MLLSILFLLPLLCAPAFGLSEPSSALCGNFSQGNIAQGIVSLWEGEKRSFRVICQNLLDAGLKPIGGQEWQGQNWQWVRRRLDIPEPPGFHIPPRNWTSGCRGNEILVGINNVLSEGLQRYEFVCVEFLGVIIDDAACGWQSPSTLKENFLIMTPPAGPFGPYVYRRARALLDTASGDRQLQFQACAAYANPEWPEEPPTDCRFRRASYEPQEVQKISAHIFARYRTEDAQECAKICSNHAFCSSFLWTAYFSSPDKFTCRLSYVRFPFEYCSGKYANDQSVATEVSGFSHWNQVLEEDTTIFVPCFECLSIVQAEALFVDRKFRAL